MSSYDYDLFVIGGGSGGVRGARVAASLGKKVAIAEEYRGHVEAHSRPQGGASFEVRIPIGQR